MKQIDRLASFVRRTFMPTTGTISGYDGSEEIADLVLKKTRAYKPEGDWPDMLGASSVLDFGGACGMHYKRAAKQNPTIRWAVVETPVMVAKAKELSTDRLGFFTSVQDAKAWLGDIDTMHSNGALHCLDDPMPTLRELCSLRAKTMIWDRIELSDGDQSRDVLTSHLIDHGPGRAGLGVKDKIVLIERTFIPKKDFIAAHDGYRLVEQHGQYFKFYWPRVSFQPVVDSE